MASCHWPHASLPQNTQASQRPEQTARVLHKLPCQATKRFGVPRDGLGHAILYWRLARPKPQSSGSPSCWIVVVERNVGTHPHHLNPISKKEATRDTRAHIEAQGCSPKRTAWTAARTASASSTEAACACTPQRFGTDIND